MLRLNCGYDMCPRVSYPMPTMRDVADKAGVSIATVSAVLNKSAYVSPELAKRVNEAVAELDYTINHVAHSLQTRSTRTIGMLIPDVANPDPFFGQVVRGAEDALRAKGYLLFLGHTYNKVEEQTRYLAAFRARLVDGVMLFQVPGEDSELDRLLQARKPVVFVGRIPKDIKADIVATDIKLGTQLGLRHILQKGHKRIGLITVAASLSVAAFRIETWRAQLRKCGVMPDERYIASIELSFDSAARAAAELMRLPDPPTALFADNLVVGAGAVRGIQDAGRCVPEDVMVVSSDDADWLDAFRPAITTIVQPSYDLGTRAAEMLLKRIQHPKRPYETVLLKPALRVRS
jgi:LacI family transcriptional regulator